VKSIKVKKKLIATTCILAQNLALGSAYNSHFVEKTSHYSLTTKTTKILMDNRKLVQKNRTNAKIKNGMWYVLGKASSMVGGPAGQAAGILVDGGKYITKVKLEGQELVYRQKVKSAYSKVMVERNREFYDIVNSDASIETKEAELLSLVQDSFSMDRTLNLSEEEKKIINYNLSKQSLKVARNIIKHQAEFRAQTGERFEELRGMNERLGSRVDQIDVSVQAIAQNQLKLSDDVEVLSQTVATFQADYEEFKTGISTEVSRNTSLIERNNQRIATNRESIQVNSVRIERVARDVWGNTVRIEEISSQVEILENDMDFHETLIFGNLSDTQKLAALKHPRFLDSLYPAGSAKREEIEAKLELAVKRNEIASMATSFAQDTQAIIQIASNLELFGDDQEKFNEIAGYAVTAANLTAQISTGNYLQAAVTITGLFAKSKPSAEEVRHQQIMQQFEIVNAKLDLILENQQKIFENVVKIQEMIVEVSQQIEGFRKGVDLKLDLIQGDLASIINIVSQNTDTSRYLDNCSQLYKSREEVFSGSLVFPSFVPRYDREVTYIDFIPGNITNLGELKSHLDEQDSYGISLEDCKKGINFALRKSINRQGYFDSHVLLSSYAEDTQSFMSKLIMPVYNPLFERFLEAFPISRIHSSGELISENFGAFVSLVGAGSKLADFNSSYKEISPEDELLNTLMGELDYSEEVHLEALKNIVHPKKLLRVGHLLLESVPYFEITRSDYVTLSDEEIFAGKFTDKRRYVFRTLRNFLGTLNYAVAQQRILSGVPVMSILDRDLTGVNGTERKEEVQRALLSNSLLLRNYLRFKLAKNFKSVRTNPEIKGDDSEETVLRLNLNLYEEALESGNFEGLGILTELTNKLGSHVIKKDYLPSPQALLSGTFLETEDLYELNEFRSKVMDFIFHYQFSEKVDTDVLMFTLPNSLF
jgi:hypothetical protein